MTIKASKHEQGVWELFRNDPNMEDVLNEAMDAVQAVFRENGLMNAGDDRAANLEIAMANYLHDCGNVAMYQRGVDYSLTDYINLQ